MGHPPPSWSLHRREGRLSRPLVFDYKRFLSTGVTFGVKVKVLVRKLRPEAEEEGPVSHGNIRLRRQQARASGPSPT